MGNSKTIRKKATGSWKKPTKKFISAAGRTIRDGAGEKCMILRAISIRMESLLKAVLSTHRKDISKWNRKTRLADLIIKNMPIFVFNLLLLNVLKIEERPHQSKRLQIRYSGYGLWWRWCPSYHPTGLPGKKTGKNTARYNLRGWECIPVWSCH